MNRSMKVATALSLSLATFVAVAVGASADSGGTYSGTMHVSSSYSGVAATGTGTWSITIAAGGAATGDQRFDLRIDSSGADASLGCTQSPSAVDLVISGTFKGNVVGANVVGSWRETTSWSPATVTVSCGGTPTSETYPTIPATSVPATMPLSKLQNGTAFSSSGGGDAITYVSSKSTNSGGSSNTSSSSSSDSTPPVVQAPATPLPAPSNSPAPDSCSEVKSVSGSIDMCVPSWLSGSTSTGVRIIGADGSVQSGSTQLTPGSSVATSATQYANFVDASAGAGVSLAPDTSVQLESGDLTSSGLATCADLPADCTNIASTKLLSTVKDALETALEGNTSLAMLKVSGGILNLEQDAFSAVTKSAEILSSWSTYDVPSSTAATSAATHIAGSTKIASDVEIKVTKKGTYLYQMSGSSLVVNSASQKFTTLKSGHVVFIPKSTSKAKSEKLAKNIKSFKTSSVKAWWS